MFHETRSDKQTLFGQGTKESTDEDGESIPNHRSIGCTSVHVYTWRIDYIHDIYIYVCMYVYIYICTYIYIQTVYV